MSQPADSIHVTDLASVATLRQQSLSQVAMVSGSVVESIVTSPLGSFANLGTVRKLTTTCNGLTAMPHLYEAASPNGHLVIVHQGHGGTHESYGTGELIRTLVGLGCDVLAIVMIGGGETTSGSTNDHSGKPLWQHLSQIKTSLDFCIAEASYDHIGMTGISGGGWATVVYAGIDSRITKSVSVAGYLPLYMTVSRDDEQLAIGSLPTSYLDLAIMAASNGRHVQLLHTNDDCCFRASQYATGPDYEAAVTAKAAEVGGSYSLTWVDQVPHEISTTDRAIITNELGLTNMPTTQITLPYTSITLAGEVDPPSTPNSTKWVYWPNQGYSRAAGDGSAFATWQHSSTGQVTIGAKWFPYGNRATNATYKIYDGEMLLASIAVNQQLAPSGVHQTLGTWTFANSMKVVLENSANGYIIADEILLLVESETSPPPPPPPSSTIEQHLQNIEAEIAAIRGQL